MSTEERLGSNPPKRNPLKRIASGGLRTGEFVADTGRVALSAGKYALYFRGGFDMIFHGEDGNPNAHRKLARSIALTALFAIPADAGVLPYLILSPQGSLLEKGIMAVSLLLLNSPLILGVVFSARTAARDVRQEWGWDRRNLKEERKARRERLGLS